MPTHIEMMTTLAYAKGAYSAAVELGSEGHPANLLLDTGSSTMVVLPHAYPAERDTRMKPTAWAQRIKYGAGAWAGPVLNSQVTVGEGKHRRTLPSAHFAVVKSSAQDFRDCDGLLGLAFRDLDRAHDVAGLLAQQGIDPALTWPWPFDVDDPENFARFRETLRAQPRLTIRPLFSALEEEGIVADEFALLVRRSLVHVTEAGESARRLSLDPLNRGVLVLGGGEECERLYEGALHAVKIVHERYYNCNLVAVSVGDQDRIPAPPLEDKDVAAYASNAIVDTGCSFLVLERSLYAAVLEGLARHHAAAPAIIERFRARFRTEHGLPNDAFDNRRWPDLHFHLESPSGGETTLTVDPGDYWQRNAVHPGECFFMLMEQLPGWPRQTILGLPLLGGRYCVFDRRGSGVLRVARATAAPA
jgi:hypothetical protein